MRWYNFFHIYQPPAWDEAIIRRVADESYQPILSILEDHPEIRITLNLTGALTEQFEALGLHEILARLKKLVDRHQIELVGSAMYHPILPLIPPDELRRQVELQSVLHQQVFGPTFRARGFYCPEMAYSPALDTILTSLGYEWVILDEICHNGQIGSAQIDRPYVTPTGLKIVFRNRQISDYLSFSSDIANPADSLRAIQQDTRSANILVTAMDGENLGHHRHGVERLWEFLVTYPSVSTGTISEMIDSQPGEPLTPRAGSWSSQPAELVAGVPFGLWHHPQNPIHQLQWQLTNTVIQSVTSVPNDVNFPAARRLLDRSLASDRYWWASASPWWDMTIIIRETQKLVDAISPLALIPARTRSEVERMMQQVSSLVQNWDRAGLAKQRQQAYLVDTGDVRYMGGQQVGEQ